MPPARQTGQPRLALRQPRKVRTPQGRIAANSRPANLLNVFVCQTKPRNRATETSLRRGRRGNRRTAPGRRLPYRVKASLVFAAWQGETRQPLSGATSNRHAYGFVPDRAARSSMRVDGQSVRATARPDEWLPTGNLSRSTESGLQVCLAFKFHACARMCAFSLIE